MATNPNTLVAYEKAPSTLAELVAPLTEAEFLTSLRERKLLHVRSANNGCYAELMGWAAVRGLIERGGSPRRDYLRVVRESKQAPIERWSVDGKVDFGRLEECLRDGFSILLTHVEETVPFLDALCQDLSARLLETACVVVVVSSGAEGAIRLHYDVEDLIVLQVEGSKRWQVFGPPVSNPVLGMVKPPAPADEPPVFDEVLEPGDFLLVPAGYWHHCQTTSGRSIHLSLGLVPPNSCDAVQVLASDLLTEELFRTPLTRVEDAAQRAALEAAVKKRLIEKVGAMRLSDFPGEWNRRCTEIRARGQKAHEQQRGLTMGNSGIRVVSEENSSAPRPALGLVSSATPQKEPPPRRSSSFLDQLSLQSLVAPVSTEEFRAHYWQQQPLIVQRGNPDYYGDLFTLDDFDSAITRAPAYVKLANAESKKNVSYKPVVEGLEAVLADMRAGGTLVLDQLHNNDPKLSLLCRGLAAELGHRFQTNLYLTPPHGRGFTPHWDNHDVFILQVVGSKHWKLEKTRRTLPQRSESMGDEGRELQGEVTSFKLQQGDLIYIPRGWIHAAECGEEPSLHITLGVTAFFFEELLTAAVKAVCQRDAHLNSALPLGFMHGSGDELVRRLKEALHEMHDDQFLAQLVEQYRDEAVRAYPLDISGQVRDFFRPRPITLDDVLEPRRGSVYRVHVEADSVRVNFGARSITFLGLFREALEFALHTPSYTVREIKGDLADEERIVFIERLIEEGLVTRQSNRLA